MTDQEKLGKFYSPKERGGNIRCIAEQNSKIKLQFESGTGLECDSRYLLILLIFGEREKT